MEGGSSPGYAGRWWSKAKTKRCSLLVLFVLVEMDKDGDVWLSGLVNFAVGSDSRE